MKIAVASDHAGYPLKDLVVDLVGKLGHVVVDLGAHQIDKDDDYPDYARYVGQAIQHGQADRGILLCGSGIGAGVAANKLKGVRAGVCHDAYSARQCVEHDDVNVLCLGARIVGISLAEDLIRTFLAATYSGGTRHARRLEKINAMEQAG
jgi:ribose 5-phosphate isomerase B